MAGNIPTGVKVISVLYYIGAAFELLGALLLFVGAGAISKVPVLGALGALGAGLFVFVAVILIGIAVLSFFVARGLWKGQKWARLVAIIFAAVGVLFALLGMSKGQFTSNVLSLVLSGVIGGYLLFSKGVKAAFA